LSELLEGAVLPEEPTQEQLADACMWNRHDFGLLDDELKEFEMFKMRERWRAIWKAINTPGRGKEYMPSNAEITGADRRPG
jgi:hypothetical protein